MKDSKIEKIKQLRSITGLSIIECKKALVSNNMDLEKALASIKKTSLIQASTKSQRIATSGQISTLVNNNQNKAIISEINCETDFVAKSKEFINFVEEVNKIFIEDNDIKDELIILSNNQKLPTSVEQKRINIIAQLGENIIIKKIRKINSKKNFITAYNHTINNLCKIAAIVITNNSVEKYNNLYTDIAMQIIAMNPTYISIKNIPEEIIENEPEKNIKMFFKTNVLLEQDFIKDKSISIKNVINNKFEIIDFYRFELGEKDVC